MSGVINPELRRRLANIDRHWQARYQEARDNADLARMAYDRARAAARRAERDGSNPTAMHDLAQLLVAWAERMERAEVRRQSGHGA